MTQGSIQKRRRKDFEESNVMDNAKETVSSRYTRTDGHINSDYGRTHKTCTEVQNRWDPSSEMGK